MNVAFYFWCAFILLISACTNEIKFDADLWKKDDDPLFPPSERVDMVNDLITNHRLQGLTYAQLTTLLGKPNIRDSGLIIYHVVIDYGKDIDPVYTESLAFKISTDSIVTSFRIKEWRK